MLRRLAPLLLILPLLGLAGLSPAAHADPVPPLFNPWPRCGTAPDDDGQYCIVSVTKDGAPVPVPDYGTDGTYDEPYVDLLDAGTVRFGLYKDVVSGGLLDQQADVDPGHTWVYTVNVGSIRPNELYGNVRDVGLSFGGNASTGYTFSLTFKPTPIAHRLAAGFSCSYDTGCGDDTTLADTVYGGFVTGYVTDDASSGLSASEIADRHGYVAAYSAQDAYSFYDPDTNSLVVRMANPHLASPGVPATGNYEARIPDAMLVNELGVPDPSTLTTGSFTVARTGSSSAVPFTVTRYAGGVEVKIDSITFSTPQYKIHPKPTAPGAPRWGSVRRVNAHSVKVLFRAPRADGGRRVASYAARCRRGHNAWHTRAGTSSPVVVTNLPARGVSCQVRARNAIGWGAWSPLKAER
jgi:hypothetical protein